MGYSVDGESAIPVNIPFTAVFTSGGGQDRGSVTAINNWSLVFNESGELVELIEPGLGAGASTHPPLPGSHVCSRGGVPRKITTGGSFMSWDSSNFYTNDSTVTEPEVAEEVTEETVDPPAPLRRRGSRPAPWRCAGDWAAHQSAGRISTRHLPGRAGRIQ